MNNSLTVQLACHAMATRFEFVLCGSDEVALRAAGEEAIREIRRIESKFSFYNPTSVISKLNARAGYESVRTDPETFHFIQQASQDRKSTRLNSSHVAISYAVFCLKKKKKNRKCTDDDK